MSEQSMERRFVDGAWRWTPREEGKVQSVTVTLDDTQIGSLRSAPVEIVPAPGVGNVIVGLAAIIRFHNGGGYSGIDATCIVGFRYDYTNSPIAAQIVGLYEAQGGVSGLLDVGEDTMAVLGISSGIHPAPDELAFTNEQVVVTALAANKALLLAASNAGSFTSGGAQENAMAVTVVYTISSVVA